MGKNDELPNHTLRTLYDMFPKPKWIPSALIDTRFESSFDVIRRTILNAATPSAFGNADSVVGIVLRLDPAIQSTSDSLPDDDAQIAKLMIMDNFHTTLLPIPRTVDPRDSHAQSLIDVYPEFFYDKSLNGKIVTGALVSATFSAGSLDVGRINSALDMNVQHLMEAELAEDLSSPKPDLFREDVSLEDLPSSTGQNKPKYKRIYIDYGHGGMVGEKYQMKPSEGKKYTFKNYSGPPLSAHGDPNTLFEGEYNREVAWRLINMLLNITTPTTDVHEEAITIQEQEVEVHDVVAGKKIDKPVTFYDLEQSNVSLRARTRYANKEPKDSLYISLHGNAAGSSKELAAGNGNKTRGVIIFTSGGSDGSDAFGDTLYNSFKSTATGMKVKSRRGEEYAASSKWKTIDCTPLWNDDGSPQMNRKKTKQLQTCKEFDPKYLQATQTYKHDYEANFYVLSQTRMDSCLGEIGFFTNLEDAQIQSSHTGQDMIALAYFKAIVQHLEASDNPQEIPLNLPSAV